jgi:predicted RND superfamily exporter protein
VILARRSTDRLAAALSRRPLRVATGAVLVCALAAAGLLRFSVDSGQSLLVGSTSSAGATYAQFSKTFGSDPIVLVFSTAYGNGAGNPLAPYIELNLERLAALELDLTYDNRVASVLGPGTVAGSLEEAALSEVDKVVAEYPYFVAETELFEKAATLHEQLQAGTITQAQYTTKVQALSGQLQSNVNVATAALDVSVIKAASDAHNARALYTPKPGDLTIDSRERAADAAVAKDAPPPGWAQYLAGPLQPTNATAAEELFERVTSAFGDCDPQIASVLKITPSCQVFFERTLLDLPDCPPVGSASFCLPKSQWAAVLPPPVAGGPSYMAITIRLKPQYVGDQSALNSLLAKINRDLTVGVSKDAYSTLSASRLTSLKALGKLAPTECGGQTDQEDPTCYAAFQDAPLVHTIAGAPLLGEGVVTAMSGLLVVLLPVAALVMLIILIGVFRVRGRWWPLLAALAATGATIGLTLLTGTPITPAVLASVPVLLGLGVDYAVQLVARYSEERADDTNETEALRTVLHKTGGATLVAAIATLAGLVALVVLSGIDWGPLVAVPLVAEFAIVLCGGVVIAWLSGVFIALPLAVWSNRRRGAEPAGAPAVLTPKAATRTIAIADNWSGIVVPLALLALVGWFALHFVPVQTDPQQLVAPSLPQLQNIETVQQELGYTNEIDIYLRGQVAGGAIDQTTGVPASVEWQCSEANAILAAHPTTVAEASSIGDFFIASSSATTASSAPSCVATPSVSSPTPSPTPSPAAGPTPSASSSPTPSSSTKINQTTFLCELRLLPLLSRALVMPISPDTPPCPAVDEYQGTFFTPDTGPINPQSARIALGIDANTVAAQAQLVDELRGEVADNNTPNGITATPTGLAVLVATAYDNLVNRAYLLNVAPLLVVALALWLIYRRPRRALLPLVPTVFAAGWAPLILLALGRIPTTWGPTLGSLNPLTIVLGALVVALGTEFGVVLLNRFYEERGRGLDPNAAAAAALAGVGRAIRVSALTLGAGFAVLAVSGLFPFVTGLPLITDFGLVVVIDLGLAVGAVFLVMLPVAVALERSSPLVLAPVTVPVAVVPMRPARRPRSRPVVVTDEPAPVVEIKPKRRPRVAKPKAPAEADVKAAKVTSPSANSPAAKASSARAPAPAAPVTQRAPRRAAVPNDPVSGRTAAAEELAPKPKPRPGTTRRAKPLPEKDLNPDRP